MDAGRSPAGPRRFALRRQVMVADLARRGIRDARVLAAMERVPRHRFCEPADAAAAYEDGVLLLPHGATLSQPFVVAAMLEALDLRGGERALDIGSGSGYTTALLCELCGAVYAVEREPGLVARADHVLQELGYGNYRVRAGDGWEGWHEHFPYDAILVSAAAPAIPPALLDQLAPGGSLVVPVGGELDQLLRVLETEADGGRPRVRDLFAVRFVPLVRSTGRPER